MVVNYDTYCYVFQHYSTPSPTMKLIYMQAIRSTLAHLSACSLVSIIPTDVCLSGYIFIHPSIRSGTLVWTISGNLIQLLMSLKLYLFHVLELSGLVYKKSIS